MTQPYGQQPPPPGQPQYGQPLSAQPQPGQPQYAQPQYGQPPPGQPQYGQPQGAYGRPSGGLTFGIVGAIIAVLGAALCVVAFTAVDWFTHASTDGPSHYSDVKKALDGAGGFASGVSKLYFSWLAWALLALALILALIANAPTSAAGPLRPIGLVIALASIAVSFWALKFLTVSSPSYTEYLKHARLGFYFAVGGFLLIGIGALIGPRRRV